MKTRPWNTCFRSQQMGGCSGTIENNKMPASCFHCWHIRTPNAALLLPTTFKETTIIEYFIYYFEVYLKLLKLRVKK